MRRSIIIFIYFLSATFLFSRDTAMDLYTLAQEAREGHRYEEAIEYYEKAGDLWLAEGNEENYVIMQNEIGYLYYISGKYDLALEYYERALMINEEKRNRDGVATDLNNIGSLYFTRGEYDNALHYYKRALVISEDLGKKAETAIRLSNLGTVYYAWGKYTLALEYYKRALAVDQEIGNKDGIATDFSLIGLLYDSLRKYEMALEYYNRALVIDEELGRKAGIAIRLNNIGGVYVSSGKYNRALEYYERALAINRELGRRGGVAAVFGNIGTVYKSLGKYNLALENYKRALVIDEELDRKPKIAAWLNNMGAVYSALEEYNQAIEYFKRAISLLEDLRLTAPGDLRRDYLASQIHTYKSLISATIRAGKPEEALEAAEQSKARLISEKIGEGLGVSAFTFRTASEIRRGLGRDEAILVYANIDGDHPAVILVTSAGIEAREFDTASFIEAVDAEYREDIQFVLESKRGVEIEGKKDGGEETPFDAVITYYRSLLSTPHRHTVGTDPLDTIGRALYTLLLDPIRGGLKGKRKLTVIPDGVLGFLPFETLVDERGHYLVEKYSVRYAQSLTVSELIRRRSTERRAGDEKRRELVAFGGAVYSDDTDDGRGGNGGRENSGQEQRAGVTEREVLYSINRGSGHMGELYDRMGLVWDNLPATMEEVREIGSLYPGATIYTGIDVNESNVKEMSARGVLDDYRVLHFSTHGMVVPDYPELSALVLSQTGDTEEDNYLTMKEIAALDIDADFVNLSACETGLGKLYAGEGIVGLTQSFLLAGAGGLSVSLWQVADESTKEFMVGMYRKVKAEGVSYSEAIRQMKLEFSGGREYDTRYSHPFYWAPFIYYGE